jgi:hypothetical protein
MRSNREEGERGQHLSLVRRLRSVRTVGSIVFGIALLVLLFRVVLDIDFTETGSVLVGADLGLLALGWLAYYATFPMRGFRWWFVLRRAGERVPVRDATEVVFIAWFVNCLVPAKLGDLYRAYLLKGNFGTPFSRTVGTIFIERVSDLLVMFWLALAAAYWSLQDRSRPDLNGFFVLGLIVGSALVVVVVALRYGGEGLTRRLPVKAAGAFRMFREGSTRPLTAGSLPVIGAVTAMVWIAEGVRLYFVMRALDLPGSDLGLGAAVFVALAGSLLTAIPLTPAGIGFVEAGIVGALALFGVPLEQAAAVAVADRAITILSVIVLGGIAYTLSPKVRRAHGLAVPGPEPGNA